jgi:leucine-rich repeat protein SHOC2
LDLSENQLTSLPVEIGQLTSLRRELHLNDNQLTSMPAAIGEFRAAGCEVGMDDGVTYDE